MVHQALGQLGYKILESNLEYIPINRVTLSEADLAAAVKLHEKLTEEPDVVKIHDNIE